MLLTDDNRDDGRVKHTEHLQRKFTQTYFSGESIACPKSKATTVPNNSVWHVSGQTPEQRARERMRASVWYVCIRGSSCELHAKSSARRYYYAYREGKVAFAWLGARYLNEIRAGEPIDTLQLGQDNV